MTQYELQVAGERNRVWVHAPDGLTVARFDTRSGIDIHHSVTEQMTGKPQCLRCTHTPPTLMEWEKFRAYAQDNWGIAIPADAVDFGSSDYTAAIRAAMSEEQIEYTRETFYKS